MLTSMLARSASAAVTVTLASVVALAAPLPAADAATARAVTSSSAVLSEGVGMGAAPSTRVRRVQRILDRRGFDLGPPGVDGRFGPLTAAAVRRMQDPPTIEAARGREPKRTASAVAAAAPRAKAVDDADATAVAAADATAVADADATAVAGTDATAVHHAAAVRRPASRCPAAGDHATADHFGP